MLLPIALLATLAVTGNDVPDDLTQSVGRSVEILLARQETNEHLELGVEEPVPDDQDLEDRCEWPYQGVYRVKRQIPWGYRIGGTSIACIALLEAPGHAANEEAVAAVERGFHFVLESLEEDLMEASGKYNYDVRGWGHTYALSFLLRLRKAEAVPAKLSKKVDKKIKWLVRALEDTQLDDGGWNYSRRGGDRSPASPFMTGPTLLALYEAKAQGVKVSKKVVEAALDTLEASRWEADGSYPYTASPRKGDGMPGATGRTPIVEIVLQLAGRGDASRLKQSLDGFFEHWQYLEDRRRQSGTHIPPYNIAPYYFFYAHRYAAMAIEFLPEEERAEYRAKFLERLFQVQEESGGWNDRVFDRSENFGTAMSLLALIEPSLPRPAGWE